MRRSDVVLTNSAGVHAIPIAEYVVAGILHFLRGFDVAIAQQHERRWDKAFFVSTDAPLREMDSVRALIVGTGGLGGETAKRLFALGATCTGVRRRGGVWPPAGVVPRHSRWGHRGELSQKHRGVPCPPPPPGNARAPHPRA